MGKVGKEALFYGGLEKVVLLVTCLANCYRGCCRTCYIRFVNHSTDGRIPVNDLGNIVHLLPMNSKLRMNERIALTIAPAIEPMIVAGSSANLSRR